jgi:hypothetical protein
VPAPSWLSEALLVLLRWLHDLSAIAFLGFGLAYLLRREADTDTAARRARFKEVMDLTFIGFLATGTILSVDRLSNDAGPLYAAILGAKIVVSAASYQFAFRWRRSGLAPLATDGKIAMALGAIVVLLGAVLIGVFEFGLRGEQ